MKNSFFSLEIDKRSGYSRLDAIRLLLVLEKRVIGRSGIIKELGLEEASVKTMVSRLKGSGLLANTTKGQALTKKGRLLIRRLSSKLSDFFEVRLQHIGPCVFVIVKSSGKRLKLGIEQRDEGMKLGVKIITLVYKGSLEFPGTKERASGFEILNDLCDFENNDVVIIASGAEKTVMRRALVGAALTVAQ